MKSRRGQLTERNKELKKDYQKGMSIVDMVAKYRITSTRIYQILDLDKVDND